MKCNHYTFWVALLMAFAGLSLAQPDSPVVTLSQGLPSLGYQIKATYSGSNLTYRCLAKSTQNRSTITVSAATNANPVVFTATAHGLDYNNGATTLPALFISGATGGWAGINGMRIATPTSANAFSIPVDSSGFGTFAGQTITVTTAAPRVTQTGWAIQHLVYDASSNLIWAGWAVSTTGTTLDTLKGGSPSFTFVCNSQATYAYQ